MIHLCLNGKTEVPWLKHIWIECRHKGITWVQNSMKHRFNRNNLLSIISLRNIRQWNVILKLPYRMGTLQKALKNITKWKILLTKWQTALPKLKIKFLNCKLLFVTSNGNSLTNYRILLAESPVSQISWLTLWVTKICSMMMVRWLNRDLPLSDYMVLIIIPTWHKLISIRKKCCESARNLQKIHITRNSLTVKMSW